MQDDAPAQLRDSCCCTASMLRATIDCLGLLLAKPARVALRGDMRSEMSRSSRAAAPPSGEEASGIFARDVAGRRGDNAELRRMLRALPAEVGR